MNEPGADEHDPDRYAARFAHQVWLGLTQVAADTGAAAVSFTFDRDPNGDVHAAASLRTGERDVRYAVTLEPAPTGHWSRLPPHCSSPQSRNACVRPASKTPQHSSPSLPHKSISAAPHWAITTARTQSSPAPWPHTRPCSHAKGTPNVRLLRSMKQSGTTPLWLTPTPPSSNPTWSEQSHCENSASPHSDNRNMIGHQTRALVLKTGQPHVKPRAEEASFV